MRKLLFVLGCILLALLIFFILVFVINKRPEKGALQATSSPASEVYLNDKHIGKTPLCLCQGDKMVDAGDYTIRLVPISGDFEPFQHKITITKKILTVVDRNFAQTALAQASIITLKEIEDKKQAQISVVSFPSGADVYLDSNLVGHAPILLKNVTESDHEIKVSKSGYREKSVRIRALFGYRLDSIIYLGVDPNAAKESEQKEATPSATLTTGEKIVIQNTPTGFLRVRESPSTAGAEVGRVNPGEEYDLLDEQNGWYQIKLKDGKTTGWVSGQYAKKQS
ncbi:MAG: hypothetical protein A3B38_04045 [Candidatus Levybacteria bacterium RIFCSPLOWO2_01_FULL_36_13]|nr:MAG: hypothetical protein A2684_04420 [Candidatus Levybacteria bacterium RIFCSPHIGHO2_01_FULL_36_15b]OGH34298.1 MAG: hypothetical protein A3B38_04045 [Candidatus Levybacteria bacterium RIFCSPLOWO2_01_FULL_36_13]